MRMYFSVVVAGSLLIFLGCAFQSSKIFHEVRQKNHRAVTPTPIPFEEVKPWYGPRMEAVNERLRQGDVDLLFVGNSITHGWESTGKKYWDLYYAPRKAMNLGFGWDWTQHVLWRLDRTDFSKISPKLAIVLIGTNNSNGEDHTAEEIADGIIAVVDRLQTRFPKMKILLLAIFPREPGPCPQREKIEKANRLVSRIADGKRIHFLDLGHLFLLEDGRLNQALMPDFLHPNEEGYRVWAEAMEPKIKELLGEKP